MEISYWVCYGMLAVRIFTQRFYSFTDFLNMSAAVHSFIYSLATPLSPKHPLEKRLKKKIHYRGTSLEITRMEKVGGWLDRKKLYRGGTGGLEVRLNISQQCAFTGLKAKKWLPCINDSIDSKSREVTPPLFSTCMAAATAAGPVLGFLLQERCQQTRVGSAESHGDGQWWEHTMYKDSLR